MNLKGGHTFTYQNTQYYSTKGRKLCLLMTKPKQFFLFISCRFLSHFFFYCEKCQELRCCHSQSQPVTLKKEKKFCVEKKTAKNMNSFIKGIVTFGLTIF